VTLDLDRGKWQRVQFGEVVENVNENAKDPSAVGIDRVIGLEHLDPGELRIERWGEVTPETTFTRRVRPGQTLFGKRRAYQRKTAYAGFDAVCSGDILVFESADPARLLPELLPFIAMTDGFYDKALETSAGSLSPRTRWSDLAKYEFDLPPLDQQRRIADLLWCVERASLGQLALISSLDRCESAVIDSEATGFQKTLTPAENLLLEGPRNGLSLSAHDEQSGYPTVTLTAIRGGEFVAEGNLKWVAVDHTTIEPFLVQDGDFFVVRGNGNRELVARGGMAREGSIPEDCFYPDLLIRLRFDPAKIIPEFAAAQWNSIGSHRTLLRVAKTTNGTYKINGKDVKNHLMWVPPRADQTRIVSKLQEVAASRIHVDGQLRNLRRLRASILDEVFKG